MTTVVLRPNGIVSGSANYTATGAATAHAATNDDSDTTYVRKTAGVNGTASLILNFGTTAITSSQTIRRVRLRARVQTPTTDGKMNLALGTRNNGVNYFASATQVRGTQATGEIVGAWFTVAPDGKAWNQTRIDDLRCQITEYRDATDRGYVYELYIDVDKATKPTLTVSNPTGTITTTSKPEVLWTYSDADGDAQSYYEVKVFASSSYGSGSFDPSSATPVWGSGQQNNISNSVAVGDYLEDGTYRAYVRVAKTINAAPFWSDWAYSGFTINLAQPPTPTVSTAWVEAQNRTLVTVTGAAATGYDSQTFELQRSDDAGLTWTGVVDADALTPNGSFAAEIYDYTAPRGIDVAYRARSIAIVGSDVVASVWSTSAIVSITQDGKWWFKAMTNSSLNASAVKVLNGLDEEMFEDVGVFRPIGRTRAVVIAGSIYGRDGSYRVVTLNDAEWASMYALITHQGTLLVQDPFGEQKFIRVVSRKFNTTGAVGSPRREIELTYVEVAE